MALKGKRTMIETQITKKCDVVAERGKVVVSAADGFVTIDNSLNGAELIAGLLLEDVEDRDLTKFPSNQHKNLAQVSGQVSLLRKGKILTDAIPSGITIAQYEVAFLADSGLISNVPDAGDTASGLIVGHWLSVKDADGFAELSFHLD